MRGSCFHRSSSVFRLSSVYRCCPAAIQNKRTRNNPRASRVYRRHADLFMSRECVRGIGWEKSRVLLSLEILNGMEVFMKIYWKLAGIVILAALVTQVQAQERMDTFSVGLNAQNQLTDYVSEMFPNTGWNGGEWIEYDQTGWWNQWFYDHPPDPMRMKKIHYDIHVYLDSATVNPMVPEIAFNWSTLNFPETSPAGPPPMADQEVLF